MLAALPSQPHERIGVCHPRNSPGFIDLETGAVTATVQFGKIHHVQTQARIQVETLLVTHGHFYRRNQVKTSCIQAGDLAADIALGKEQAEIYSPEPSTRLDLISTWAYTWVTRRRIAGSGE